VAGYRASFPAGRRGLTTSSPAQLGQRPFSGDSAQAAQNVHSNEQIRAWSESGGSDLPQHSQQGL